MKSYLVPSFLLGKLLGGISSSNEENCTSLENYLLYFLKYLSGPVQAGSGASYYMNEGNEKAIKFTLVMTSDKKTVTINLKRKLLRPNVARHEIIH